MQQLWHYVQSFPVMLAPLPVSPWQFSPGEQCCCPGTLRSFCCSVNTCPSCCKCPEVALFSLVKSENVVICSTLGETLVGTNRSVYWCTLYLCMYSTWNSCNLNLLKWAVTMPLRKYQIEKTCLLQCLAYFFLTYMYYKTCKICSVFTGTTLYFKKSILQ